MNVIADLCIIPMGVGVSVSKYVAECERILQNAGLRTLHAYAFNLEEGNGMTCLRPLKPAMTIFMQWVFPESAQRSQVRNSD